MSRLSTHVRALRSIYEAEPFSFLVARWPANAGEPGVNAAELSFGANAKGYAFDLILGGAVEWEGTTDNTFSVAYQVGVHVYVRADHAVAPTDQECDLFDVAEDVLCAAVTNMDIAIGSPDGPSVTFRQGLDIYDVHVPLVLRYEHDAKGEG